MTAVREESAITTGSSLGGGGGLDLYRIGESVPGKKNTFDQETGVCLLPSTSATLCLCHLLIPVPSIER